MAPSPGTLGPRSGMAPTFRDRFFESFVGVAARYSGMVLLVIGVMTLIGALLASRLDISTSRYGLVSKDVPSQARLFEFFERFGNPDSPVIVVSGATAEQRRTVVDALSYALERESAFAGKVLGRVGPRELAEVLLLFATQDTEQVGAGLPPAGELASVIEGGVPALLDVVHGQLEAGLDGQSPIDPTAADRGLVQLALLARALTAQLQGQDPLDVLGEHLAARQFAQHNVDEKGYLAGHERSHHLIALFPDLSGDEYAELEPIVASIRDIRDRTLAQLAIPGISARVTGLPALKVDEMAVIRTGLYQSSVVTTLGIVLLLAILFRSWTETIVALIPLGTGMAITLGVVELLYGQLNLVTSSMVSVLLGLGIDIAVHVLERYHELVRAGIDRMAAMRGAMTHAGPGILTGSITTVLAFMAVLTTEFTAFAELGLLSSIGILVMLLTTFFLLPVFALTRFGARKILPAEFPGMATLPGLVRRAPRLVLVAALLASVISAIAGPRVDFNTRYFDFLPRRNESAAALDMLERDGAMGPTFAMASAEGVEATRALTERLRSLPVVGEVQSPTDLLPPLDENRLASLRHIISAVGRTPDFTKLANRAIDSTQLAARAKDIADVVDEIRFALVQAGRSATAAEQAKAAFASLAELLLRGGPDVRERLTSLHADLAGMLERAYRVAHRVALRGGYSPEDLPLAFQSRFVSKDGRALAVYFYPARDIWNRDVAAEFSERVLEEVPDATGFAMTVHEHLKLLLEGFERAAGFAALAVFLVVLWDFRRLNDTLLVMLPVALGWIWMVGAMGVLGLDFNVANIVALPLLLGLGVPAAVHMVHRCRQSEREHGGVAEVQDLMRGTGSAVMVASVTTMVGFAGLMVADYGGMKSFGLVMLIGMFTCLIASVVVLSALLIVLRRAR